MLPLMQVRWRPILVLAGEGADMLIMCLPHGVIGAPGCVELAWSPVHIAAVEAQ